MMCTVMDAAESIEYTEWQWRTFHHDGKISPCLVRVGDARPPPFTLPTITSKVVVYAPAERADTLPLFLLYTYMYSVAESIPSRLKLFGCEQQYRQLNLMGEYSFCTQPSVTLEGKVI